MIRLLIYILIYSVISAWFNYQIIEGIDFHISQAILRVYTFAGMLYFAIKYKRLMLDNWFNNTIILLFMLSLYWCFFDASLNLFRGLDLFYIGKTSWIDKNIGQWMYYIKIVLLFFSTILIINDIKINRYGKG